MLNVYRQGQPNWEAIVLGEKLQRKSEIAHYSSGVDLAEAVIANRDCTCSRGSGPAWDGRRRGRKRLL